jgi:hypothetical protein
MLLIRFVREQDIQIKVILYAHKAGSSSNNTVVIIYQGVNDLHISGK